MIQLKEHIKKLDIDKVYMIATDKRDYLLKSLRADSTYVYFNHKTRRWWWYDISATPRYEDRWSSGVKRMLVVINNQITFSCCRFDMRVYQLEREEYESFRMIQELNK